MTTSETVLLAGKGWEDWVYVQLRRMPIIANVERTPRELKLDNRPDFMIDLTNGARVLADAKWDSGEHKIGWHQVVVRDDHVQAYWEWHRRCMTDAMIIIAGRGRKELWGFHVQDTEKYGRRWEMSTGNEWLVPYERADHQLDVLLASIERQGPPR